MKTYFSKIFFTFSILGLFSFCDSPTEKKFDVDSSSRKSNIATFVTTVLDTNYHNGDIVFQTSNSGQSAAIQLATHSIYSHCGLLLQDDGKWYVYEAIQPVQKTPVKEWIARATNHYYALERLAKADSILTPEAILKMRQSATSKLDKNYDLWFGWSDEYIYCSELVWKAYHDATGLEIGQLQKLGEFDLSSPVVKKQLKARYGNNVPMEEPVISPGAIFACPLLVKVRG